ncbi:uncharacterized protein METZ01_LOCUS422286 [marine metagenome]|uniref:Uncharacterized protein n=1 Tax=marine metagenome TaxID=408172 RepID=A0A382XEE4_9ZZZZ
MVAMIIVLEPYAIRAIIAAKHPYVTAFSYAFPCFNSSKIIRKPLNPWTEMSISIASNTIA